MPGGARGHPKMSGIFSGWYTTNIVTQKTIHCVPNLRVMGDPTGEGAAIMYCVCVGGGLK